MENFGDGCSIDGCSISIESKVRIQTRGTGGAELTIYLLPCRGGRINSTRKENHKTHKAKLDTHALEISSIT